MAASFSITMRCLNCGHGEGKVTITNAIQATNGTWGRKPDIIKCPHCNASLPVAFSSIAVAHSGSVGSNTTITHTITEPGTIVSGVS